MFLVATDKSIRVSELCCTVNKSDNDGHNEHGTIMIMMINTMSKCLQLGVSGCLPPIKLAQIP